MEILFRVDASKEIGTGHVMRSLTLADALKERGCRSSFVTRLHEGNLSQLIKERGYEVFELPVISYSFSELSHSHWLGASVNEDAESTMSYIGDSKFDWVVVDHYALDKRWETKIRSKCNKILVIDDLADRKHDADVLLDQNYWGELTLNRYDHLVSSKTKKLLGPSYCLLKNSYAYVPKVKHLGVIKKVLLFLGGSDPLNNTEKVFNSLDILSLSQLELHVVVGSSYGNGEELKLRVYSRPHSNFYIGLSSLAELMSQCDLMIAGGGITTWERFYLGLPSVVFTIADNQSQSNEILSQEKLINYLGFISEENIEKLPELLKSLMNEPDKLVTQSRTIQTFVPEIGTSKVVKIILE